MMVTRPRVQSQSLQSLARGIVAILRSLAIGLSLAHPSITTDRPTSHALALVHLHSRHYHHELDDNDDDDIDSRADTGQPMCRSHRHPPELPRRESAVYHHYHHHHLHRHHRMQVTASRSHPPIPSTNCRKNCSFG